MKPWLKNTIQRVLNYPTIIAIKGFNLNSIQRLLKKCGYVHQNSLGYIKDIGWFASVESGLPIDSSNCPIPWITYPAIDFLSNRIDKAFTVFEYGSGNSSKWWAKRTSHVYSVEHSREWYQQISAEHIDNLSLLYHELDNKHNYERSCQKTGQLFNIIVIDGRKRVNCMFLAKHSLTPNGIIILDNSERSRYKRGREHLIGKGFRFIDFWGMCPIVGIRSCTTIFYRENNCLGI